MAGLTTKEAIHQLKTDIELVLKEFNEHQHSRWSHLKEIFTKSSENLLLTGIAYTLTLLYSIFLIIIYFIDTNSPQSGWWLLIESFLLISMMVANFFISFNEDQLRRAEIPMRTRHVVDQLNNVLKQPDWTVENYPHLCAPISPCVTLQWVYRDGKVVNLPWALLTKGDVIIMRPGQEAPGLCESLTANGVQMTAGQIYQPAVQDKESFNTPRIRSPYKSKEYRLLETPYISNLRLALTRALKRPITVFNKQRYLCTIDLIEGITLPFVITLTLISCVVYQFVYPTPNTHWSDVYLLQTMSTSIPLLLVVFLIFWVVLNSYGLARFKQISQIRQKLIRPKSHSLSEGVNDPLIEALSETNLKADQLKSLGNLMYGILAGNEDMVTRTTNIVHVLGSISALCCVDKKGILSWPNPTAEKVFFLRNSEPAIESKTTSKSSLADSMCADNNVCDGRQQATVAEVLDLTHDKNAAFSVEFDDSTWHWHIGRLKPLGLATLLNTCTNHTALHYSDLCAHLTCEALLNEDLVPVTNRRCLCELAKQIGFKEKSTELYTQVENVSVFRRLHSESVRRETRFARSLQLSSRVKVPLPHMLSVIVRDPGGQLQMLTQGTADIILDSCLDYWNGDDLTLLTPADRKKALDFYQRNSLTAYCTAFSYKPLTHSISNKIANHYLELPPECNHMHPTQAAIWPENTDNVHFHSTDSLLYSDTKEEEVDDVSGFFDLQSDQIFLGMVTMQYQAQSDMVELIERLERSCVRFVHFSKENELRSRVFGEKMGLESGWNCHISLLSEPQNGSKSGSPETSKRNIECSKSNIPAPPPAAVAAVTSSAVHQKMAFRCYHHPEFSNLYASGEMARMKMLSTSAPGAIHLDHNIVKFYNDKPRHSVTAQDISKHTGAMVSCESEHSMVSTLEESGVEGCRSLSCLTDSTDHSAPVNFDMSNTAKLPRGIENIRPHIERIDNVPLLVSLFTDCTANSARQMMEIMQDYGEVVCVLASSANKDNMEIFMQADASIGMEPLYPVLCQKLPPYSLPAEGIGPICLARALNSVPCSLSMTRDTDISLFSLITMSRHFMLSMWNATQYWLCSVCAIALLQCICVCTNVPVCLTLGGCMLWCWLYVSCLAISLATSAPDANVMQSAATKHITHLDLQTFLFVYWCYGLRFIPSVISIYIQYSKTLEHFCKDIVVLYNSTSVQCNGVYPTGIISLHGVNATLDYDHQSWNGWGADLYDGYFLAQTITQILVTIHFVVISMSFVHRDHMCWQKCFWTNKVWVGAAMFILVTQSIWSGIMLNIVWWSPWQLSRYTVTWQLQLAYILSPCILYFINEVIKFYELRVNDRYQKRARLDFGTKLGMNSPFPG